MKGHPSPGPWRVVHGLGECHEFRVVQLGFSRGPDAHRAEESRRGALLGGVAADPAVFCRAA